MSGGVPSIYWLDDEFEDLIGPVQDLVNEALYHAGPSPLHRAVGKEGRTDLSWSQYSEGKENLLEITLCDYPSWLKISGGDWPFPSIFISDLYCLEGSLPLPDGVLHPVEVIAKKGRSKVILCTMASGAHVRTLCSKLEIARYSQVQLHDWFPRLLGSLLDE